MRSRNAFLILTSAGLLVLSFPNLDQPLCIWFALVPLILAVVGVVLLTGTLNLNTIVESQSGSVLDWYIVRQPLGVFGCVFPFNFPGMVPFWFWPYAVATGNTFVIKVSEQTPLTLTRTFEILEDADLPEGVLNLVHGDKESVDAILDSPLVKGVTFVGSDIMEFDGAMMRGMAAGYTQVLINGKKVPGAGEEGYGQRGARRRFQFSKR